MMDSVTFQQVEELVAELPPGEQLRLLGRLSEWLAEAIFAPAVSTDAANDEKERRRYADAVLAECDHAAAAFTRQTDSAETLQRIRDERCKEVTRYA